MLIRFFKEFDLIGCGGDTQPIRLQVGTLSQSDYRCVQGVCAQGVHTQGMCAQGCTRRGGGDTQPIRLQVGTLSQSDYRCTQGVCAGGVRTGDACAGDAHVGVHMQGWWGHSANQITGGDTQPIRLQVHTGGAHAGGVCTGDACAGGAHAGDAHAGGACAGDARTGGAHAGVVGTLSQSDYRWGHSANQITGACRGCAHRACMQRSGGDT